MLLPYLSHIPHVWNVWQTVSECRRGKKFHLKIELNDTSKSNLRWYMQNQFAFCILFIQWNGKKVREVVKTCHIQTFQKNLPQGNETCTCLQKFRIDSERNVKFNHLYFKFDCSNFQVFLHTMYKKKLNSRYGKTSFRILLEINRSCTYTRSPHNANSLYAKFN